MSLTPLALQHFLEFEADALAAAQRAAELQRQSETGELPKRVNLTKELWRLQIKEKQALRQTYRQLTAWQQVQVARHPERPHARAFCQALLTDFQPLAGDRNFADDPTVLAGLGRLQGQAVAVLGIEKGANTKERVHYNFGMPKPEGYRKAERIMRLADHFGLPLVTFVDTPGAYPGVEAEARGQAEAIARCIQTSMDLTVPMVSVITGEGGSGGALALATANTVLMLQHSIYSVISPEGCASILWREAAAAPQAAEALQLTAAKLLALKVVDHIIPEPVGGAHRDQTLTFKRTGRAITQALQALMATPDCRAQRHSRFLALG